jgi:hypothetical protein
MHLEDIHRESYVYSNAFIKFAKRQELFKAAATGVVSIRIPTDCTQCVTRTKHCSGCRHMLIRFTVASNYHNQSLKLLRNHLGVNKEHVTSVSQNKEHTWHLYHKTKNTRDICITKQRRHVGLHQGFQMRGPPFRRAPLVTLFQPWLMDRLTVEGPIDLKCSSSQA